MWNATTAVYDGSNGASWKKNKLGTNKVHTLLDNYTGYTRAAADLYWERETQEV